MGAASRESCTRWQVGRGGIGGGKGEVRVAEGVWAEVGGRGWWRLRCMHCSPPSNTAWLTTPQPPAANPVLPSPPAATHPRPPLPLLLPTPATTHPRCPTPHTHTPAPTSQVLCMTMVLRPPRKISLVYSSMARLESATYGTYLITTTWSGCSPGLQAGRQREGAGGGGQMMGDSAAGGAACGAWLWLVVPSAQCPAAPAPSPKHNALKPPTHPTPTKSPRAHPPTTGTALSPVEDRVRLHHVIHDV